MTKPLQLNVGLGTFEIAQERRAAYEKAAEKAGCRSLSEWARDLMDKAANFKKGIQDPHGSNRRE